MLNHITVACTLDYSLSEWGRNGVLTKKEIVMLWLILSIAAIFLIFIAIAITHVGVEADRKEQELAEKHFKSEKEVSYGK